MEKVSHEFRRLVPRAERSREDRISERLDERLYQLTEVISFKGVQRIQRLPEIYSRDQVLIIAREMRWLQKNGFKDISLSPEIVETILENHPDRVNLQKSRFEFVTSDFNEPLKV